MRREAHLVENEWVKGEWQSELVYAILEREWSALNVHHVGIAVDDLDAAIATYGALFGADGRASRASRRAGRRGGVAPRRRGRGSSCSRRSGPTRRSDGSSRGAGPACTTSRSRSTTSPPSSPGFGATASELIDESPRRGLFGLQVAFVHPEATGGVLAEFVGDERNRAHPDRDRLRRPAGAVRRSCRRRRPTISTARSPATATRRSPSTPTTAATRSSLRRVVYVKRFARESRVGFGAAA